MSFLYPRVVSVYRPAQTIAAGAGTYSSVAKVPSTLIADTLPASIQIDRTGQRPIEGLPADAVGKATWKIFIPLPYGVLGMVQDRDVIVDEIGNSYQVVAAYWNSLGYQIRAQIEET